MHNKIRCFYAYSSEPESVSKMISDGIKLINDMGIDVSILDWKFMHPSGKPIIRDICQFIDSMDVFICDLTVSNENVLFELGYAIAKRKRVWITINSDNHNAQTLYRELKMLTTIGYSSYTDAHDLRNKFLTEKPYASLNDTIYDSQSEVIELSSMSVQEPTLLFLKSGLNDSVSSSLTKSMKRLATPVYYDDPSEFSGQALSWYLEAISKAFGLVAQFATPQNENIEITNLKYALVCGLAYGFEKHILMLSPISFRSPIDYRDFVKVYRDDNEAINHLSDWYSGIKPYIDSYVSSRDTRKKYYAGVGKLHSVNLGEYLAENEPDSLSEYFIRTTAYEDALNTLDYILFVGRKGTGKTANLLYMREELSEQLQNHVCVIRPPDYQFEQIFELFNLSNTLAGKGYLVESLWKYLIYTELARSLYDVIQSRPSHYMNKSSEDELKNFIEKNESVIGGDFSERLTNAIRDVCKLDVFNSSPEQKQQVSEILHRDILAILRRIIGEVLHDKKQVYILVDNLDKGWQKRDNLELLAEFLFGLLGVAKHIVADFGRDALNKPKVNLNLVVFLRSDIFSFIVWHAREADKLNYRQINWQDKRLLQRIIEERFIYSLQERLMPDEVWDMFFDASVNSIPTKEYIVQRIIPRPRDIIYFCKLALSNAKNHNHNKILEEDIKQAEKEYSYHAYQALVTETNAEFPEIRALLTNFMGISEIVELSQIEEFVDKSGIDKSKVNRVVEVLAETTFLGLEVEQDEFVFLYDEAKKPVYHKRADDTAKKSGTQRYKVNSTFHAFLDIRG